MSSYSFQASPELQKVLTHYSKSVMAKSGEILFRESDPVRGIYLVVRGRVELLLHSAGLVTLARNAVSGCLLGVPASINRKPYSLTARVSEDTELRFISLENLDKLMKTDTQFTMQLVAMLSDEVRAMRGVLADPRKAR